MPTQKSSMDVIGKIALVFFSLAAAGALAAIPARISGMPGGAVQAQESQSAEHQNNGLSRDMPGMNMSDEHSAEGGAVKSMAEEMQHNSHSLHMHMTDRRPQTPQDVARANDVVAKLRVGMEKYRDYHVALDDGFKIFLPNFPQPEYHFTSRRNGFLGNFQFDPERPTSLLYRKTGTGYELVGAMYTMPRRATEDQLNERVPLSVASWHLHTNLCLPPLMQAKHADYARYGLTGTIATQEACDAANGHFFPVVLGWMVHVYPYEEGLDKQFPMHHDMH
jgi:hypothetical protein